MDSEGILKSLPEAARASGLDKQVLRNWLKVKTKGKVSCSLVRGGVITFEEYLALKDSNVKFYSNPLFAFLNIHFSLHIDDIAEMLSVSRHTVTSLANNTASSTTEKALFYVCEKKLGIQNAEELYFASNNKES